MSTKEVYFYFISTAYSLICSIEVFKETYSPLLTESRWCPATDLDNILGDKARHRSTAVLDAEGCTVGNIRATVRTCVVVVSHCKHTIQLYTPKCTDGFLL